MIYEQHIIHPRPSTNNIIINKQLQKDLKQLIFKLQSQEIIALFKNLQQQLGITSVQQFAKNGILCSYCQIKFQSFSCKGYGRNENEALINAIKNILETMISSSYQIENIRRALKFSVKKNKVSVISESTKKSTKKVEDFGQINLNLNKINKNKIQLDYCNVKSDQPSNFNINNKQNISKRMNETLDLDISQVNFNNNFEGCKNHKLQIDHAVNHKKQTKQSNKFGHIFDSSQKAVIRDEYCEVKQSNCDSNCVYYDIHKHSENEIKNLMARVKLLQEQNSMLKTLLLKDFDKQFFKKDKKNTN